jgi:undecaprenyl diphosphate synthase
MPMEQAARAQLLDASPASGAPYGLKHIGIIMDGNGRWATKRGLPRAMGHKAGVESLRRIVRSVSDLGVPYLTVYSFSAENWARPAAEIAELLGLLKLFIRKDLADLNAQNVRVRIIGTREGLTRDIDALLTEAEVLTRNNTGLTFLIAFNYGARQEMAEAVRLLARDVRAGVLAPDDISTASISARLSTAGVPDPDLIIRTSGEQRLSNFLLWQAAYAEFVFSPVLWPDFDRMALEDCLNEYGGRKRRFGGL